MSSKAEVLWVGSQGGIESSLVHRANIDFTEIPAAGVHGVSITKLPRNLLLLISGFFASRRIMDQFKPQVILLTGGFISVPLALAAGKTPILVFSPDIEPGLALKVISWIADCIAVTSEESKKYFSKKGRVFISGYPTRPELTKWDRPSARQKFNLSYTEPVLLIYGGSKGARSINHAVLSQLSDLLRIAQVIHISGDLDWSDVEAKRKELPSELALNYHPFPYLHEDMGAAFAATDLVISRSGASVLGEFPLFGIPAILIPYPHAWRYQLVNARYLVNCGAAVILEDSKLENELVPSVKNVLNDPLKLETMRSSMRNLSRPQAAALIGQQLFSLAGERSI